MESYQSSIYLIELKIRQFEIPVMRPASSGCFHAWLNTYNYFICLNIFKECRILKKGKLNAITQRIPGINVVFNNHFCS
jgi:hypothetical protein